MAPDGLALHASLPTCRVAKDLRLQLRGIELIQAEATLKALVVEIDECQIAKAEARSVVDEAKVHPVIVRWFAVGPNRPAKRRWICMANHQTVAD